MTYARSRTASGVREMMGRGPAIRVILGALLMSTLVLAVSCGNAGEPATPAAKNTEVPPTLPAPSPTPLPTATIAATNPTAALEGGLSRLSALGDRLAAELPENLPAELPGGLDVSEGWLQVNLATPERAAVIQELEWVADGVSPDEVAMVDWLVWTAIDYGELFDRVVEADWLADGVTEQEIQVLKHLFFLATADLGLALWLMGQPFLETVEYADGPAVESLLRVQLLVPEQANPVQALLLQTGGVTDEWAPIVAMTWPVARFAPQELPRLYDPAVVQVHTKTVDLHRSGPTLLAVVRTGPGAGETLPLVESIVREVERTMGRPLPLDYVGALFGGAVSPGAIGINYGTGMVLEPRFDVADGSYDAEKLRGVLAHEVAHYWWNSNENWVDEGMAEFLAAASYGFPTGNDYPFLRSPCARAKSLSELPPEPRASIPCDYSLGQRMFFSLYRLLGEEAFYDAARKLYDHSRADLGHRSLFGIPSGVEEVRNAFGPEGTSAVDRWYYGRGDQELDDF